MALGLRALNRFAGSELVDRIGARHTSERVVRVAAHRGFQAAGTVGRTFAKRSGGGSASRLKPARPASGLFDLTPTDEQEMIQSAAREFAATELRPAAEAADAAAATPEGLLAKSTEIGTTMLGVPEEAGGAVEERSAVTSVLLAEALAHGDLGLAFAVLAPAAVSTALGLWGDADQQATYLPEFVGEDVPTAALAVQEPRPLFDPFALRTTAARDGEDYVLSGVKSLVPHVGSAELFVVAADLNDRPALFLVESKSAGVLTEPEPAMGLRAAASGRLVLEDVRVPASALLGGGDPDVYAEAIRLGRIAWAALATGTAQAALDHVIPYVNEREAFGEPVSHRQGVAFTVSNMAIDLESLRLTTYRAASRADMGKTFAREAALARQLTAAKGMEIGSQAVQMLGGAGYVKDHPVERWYRDLRAAGVMEGALLV
ncbi:acyl-CoA dehydrogenase family protein [Patulibacter sp. NPDC049589]|uniref:acyl-CoA dehydrogenase family protein n=1 Tax=Patulibacter sp. NPDC049589 TaxID=3154731 RepID=UPI003416059B